MLEIKCPKCRKRNNDNWPIEMPDGTTMDGGCQDCWEAQCDKEWWAAVDSIFNPVEFDGIRIQTGLNSFSLVDAFESGESEVEPCR